MAVGLAFGWAFGLAFRFGFGLAFVLVLCENRNTGGVQHQQQEGHAEGKRTTKQQHSKIIHSAFYFSGRCRNLFVRVDGGVRFQTVFVGIDLVGQGAGTVCESELWGGKFERVRPSSGGLGRKLFVR